MSDLHLPQFHGDEVLELPRSMRALLTDRYLHDDDLHQPTYGQLATVVARAHQAVYRHPSTPDIARQLALTNDPSPPAIPPPSAPSTATSRTQAYFETARHWFAWFAIYYLEQGRAEVLAAEGLPVGWSEGPRASDFDLLCLRHQVWLGDKVARLVASKQIGEGPIGGKATYSRAMQKGYMDYLEGQGMSAAGIHAELTKVFGDISRRSFFNRKRRQ